MPVPSLALRLQVVGALILPAFTVAQGTVPEARLDYLYQISAPAGTTAFGRSVAVLTDVDGDTFPEFAAAATTSSGGAVYLLSGRDGSILRVFNSPQSGDGDLFGRSLSLVPDINNDGIGDLAIGAHDHTPTGTGVAAGVVYLVDPTNMTVLHELSSPSPTADGFFGFSLDGFADNPASALTGVIVGAPGENGVPVTDGPSNAGAGRAYVFNGRTGALEYTYTNFTEFSGEDATLGAFGTSVAAATGGSDFFYVGEPGADFSSSTFVDSGRVYLYQGFTQTALSTSAQVVTTDSRFGGAIALVPQIQSEFSLPGLVSGQPVSFPEDLSQNPGRAEAFDYEAFNRVRQILDPPVVETNSRFGETVAGTRDFTGDKRGEALVGHPDVDSRAGLVHIFRPHIGQFILTLPRPTEPQTRGRFGAAIAGTRDQHPGQVRQRLIIGAPGTGLPGGPAGRIYVYKMRTRLTGDMNNDSSLTANDVSLLESFLAGNIPVSQADILDVLDVDNNGVIDARDLDLLRILVFGAPVDPLTSAWTVR